MRHVASFTAVIALLVNAASSLPNQQVLQAKDFEISEALGVDAYESRTIQLGPDEIKVVSEHEKWELKRNGIKFMDITDHQDLGSTVKTLAKKSYKYPAKPQFQSIIKPLLANLTKSNMEENLEKFTSFYTRYFRSNTGRQSSEWLLSKVEGIAKNNTQATVKPFKHSWGQNSIIANIPPGNLTVLEGSHGSPKTNESTTNIVIGAHQDSVNMYLPMYLRSPGADDDGSGTVTILEAFRVLINSGLPMKNPVQFHWYSAEEGGLLGSQAIFSDYEKKGVKVGAMLQQDMTGYVQKTIDAGEPESVGVITDFVDPGLTAFIKTVITEYCDIPYIETECGYACSDHASASKAGYPSAFVIEAAFRNSDDKIHTTEDKIEFLSFDHMLQHAKLTLSLAIELGMADLE